MKLTRLICALAVVVLLALPRVLPANDAKHSASADLGQRAHAIDVKYYRLDLRIDPPSRSLRGAVLVRARRAAEAAADIELDLSQALTVDSVTLDSMPARFAHRDGRVLIAANRLQSEGAMISIVVTYHGSPEGKGFTFAERNGQAAISSYGMPFTAQQWWPSNDDPADKADTADILITVPTPLTAASNGRLIHTQVNSDGTRTYHWRVGYPIYPDTISLAIAQYAVFEDRYTASNGTVMPLQFYVFPPDEAKARRDFSVLPDIMRSHVATFGEYPFLREKYGVAEFTTNSFREHQTLPSYGDKLITGDHQNDDILAHELAHQWFGNSLTVRDWRHVWLNEGFATYAAMLWHERRDGVAAYRDALQKADDGDLMGPVFIADATDTKKLFGTATFQKGPWVLHMLRHVMGDKAFFEALSAYVKQYSYRNVTTEDFRAVCERFYGKSLAWFFQEWIYGASRPTYRTTWTPGSDARAPTLTLRQTQTDAPAFTMPIDVVVKTATGARRFVIWNDREEQTFPIGSAHEPAEDMITGVEVDPDNWILKHVVVTG